MNLISLAVIALLKWKVRLEKNLCMRLSLLQDTFLFTEFICVTTETWANLTQRDTESLLDLMP